MRIFLPRRQALLLPCLAVLVLASRVVARKETETDTLSAESGFDIAGNNDQLELVSADQRKLGVEVNVDLFDAITKPAKSLIASFAKVQKLHYFFILNLAVSLFWPSQSTVSVWDQVKEQVQKLITEAEIRRQRLDADAHFADIHDFLSLYNRRTNSRLQFFMNLDDAVKKCIRINNYLKLDKRDLNDETTPINAKMLQYAIDFVPLHLAVLWEQAAYGQYYLDQEFRQANRDVWKKDLQKQAKSYDEYFNALSDPWRKWRRGFYELTITVDKLPYPNLRCEPNSEAAIGCWYVLKDSISGTKTIVAQNSGTPGEQSGADVFCYDFNIEYDHIAKSRVEKEWRKTQERMLQDRITPEWNKYMDVLGGQGKLESSVMDNFPSYDKVCDPVSRMHYYGGKCVLPSCSLDGKDYECTYGELCKTDQDCTGDEWCVGGMCTNFVKAKTSARLLEGSGTLAIRNVKSGDWAVSSHECSGVDFGLSLVVDRGVYLFAQPLEDHHDCPSFLLRQGVDNKEAWELQPDGQEDWSTLPVGTFTLERIAASHNDTNTEENIVLRHHSADFALEVLAALRIPISREMTLWIAEKLVEHSGVQVLAKVMKHGEMLDVSESNTPVEKVHRAVELKAKMHYE